MSAAHDQANQHHVWDRLRAEYPRFASATLPSEDSVAVSVDELATPEFIARATAASKELFPMEQDRHAVQVWWFSLNNTLVAPAVSIMVEFGATPSLDIAAGQLWSQPSRQGDAGGAGYWMCFSTLNVTDSSEPEDWHRAGQEFAGFCAKVIPVICEVAGMKPGPLWAVSTDALRQAAVGAGNHAFEPYLGVRVGEALVAGFGDAAPEGITIPDTSYREIVDGEFRPAPMEEIEAGEDAFDDPHMVAKRVSCCMIFHCEKAGLCTSCPKHTAEDRDAALLESVW